MECNVTYTINRDWQIWRINAFNVLKSTNQLYKHEFYIDNKHTFFREDLEEN